MLRRNLLLHTSIDSLIFFLCLSTDLQLPDFPFPDTLLFHLRIT